jgi:class 3 adenylate cyclase
MILDFMADPSTATLSPTRSQRRLATILFTDIVGSTDRAQLSGDTAWRELLAAHDTTVRREIERFRGREVKTLGDGFLAVFDGPARAIRCARAITEAMEPLGIQVRAGLHTGEVEQSESDIQGIAVHLAARIIGEAACHSACKIDPALPHQECYRRTDRQEWGGDTESDRCRRWQDGSAWVRGARSRQRW